MLASPFGYFLKATLKEDKTLVSGASRPGSYLPYKQVSSVRLSPLL